MGFDWVAHAKHRRQVIEDRGEWIGLLSEDGVPICDMPPYVRIHAPTTRMNPESFQGDFEITSPQGFVHMCVDELVADGLGKVDAEGRLVPANAATRFIAVERNGLRKVFRVMFVVASSSDPIAPRILQVHGTDMLTELGFMPCWSIPGQVSGAFTRAVGDFGSQFSKPRYLAKLKMAAVADGFSVQGPADVTIRRLIKESLQATYKAFGVSDHPIQVADTSTGKPSPELIIRPEDRSIWEEISAPAAMAGCVIRCFMWLPEDPQPEGLHLSKPTVVVEVLQQ